MITLFQYCDHCKTEKNFNPETLICKTCNNKNYGKKDKKVV